MKYQIKEFAALCGVSVRALHYYDQIGLLKPCFVDEQNSYRFYDNKSLERMQEILFYRELDFSLKDIIEILENPAYSKEKALQKQRQLLVIKKDRMVRLIDALDSAIKGENIMEQKVFDNSEYEKIRTEFAEEAKEKWGNTHAYKEYTEKSSAYSQKEWNNAKEEMDFLICEFAKALSNGSKPTDECTQSLVKQWQDMITRNYYSCTDEILSGLGQMYVCDERFTKNMDKYHDGTARFMSDAITVYCKKKSQSCNLQGN